MVCNWCVFFFQAEDGIRDAQESRGLGDVYKRQASQCLAAPDRVAVVDSGQVSMGLGWAAVEAARMASNGAGLAEVARATRDLGPRLKTAAMIDSLDNLRKGGRINQFSALLGTALQIKPLVSLDSGQVSIWARVRSRSKALLALVERVRSWGPLAEVAVLHAGAEDLAQTLVARLRGHVDRLAPGHPSPIVPVVLAGILADAVGVGPVLVMAGIAALLAAGVRYVLVPQVFADPDALADMVRWRPPLDEAASYAAGAVADAPYLRLVFDRDGARVYEVVAGEG